MSERSTLILYRFSVIILLIIIILIQIWILFFSPSGKIEGRHPQTLQILENLRQLKLKINSIREVPKEDKEKEIRLLQKETERLEQKILNDKAKESYRDKLIEERERRSGSILNEASFIISALTFAFVAFIGVIGWLGFKKYDELKKEVDEKVKERDRINKEFSDMKEELKMFKKRFEEDKSQMLQMRKENKRQVDQTKDFARSFAGEFFSSAIIGILSTFNRSNIIDSKIDRRLRNFVAETQDLIFLRFPDTEEKRKAIFGLTGLGTEQSIPELKRVMNDDEENPEIRLLAQKAIQKIEDREKEKKKVKNKKARKS